MKPVAATIIAGVPAAQIDAAEWDAFASAVGDGGDIGEAHLLQTAAWAQLKCTFGWRVERVALRSAGRIVAGAQILVRRLPLAFGSIAYLPKGPLVNWQDAAQAQALLQLCDAAARAENAIFLKLEPDLADAAEPRQLLQALGWRSSPQSMQPRRTLLVDTACEPAAALARMKSKTRYNIGLAEKKGVVVRSAPLHNAGAELAAFWRLLQSTAARDKFGIHSERYYQTAYESFAATGRVALLLAESAGGMLAGAMIFASGSRAWYLYGASDDLDRASMAPYAVQWAAIQWAHARGCSTYDLWGVPDFDETQLETAFTTRSDALWPVYRFKRGFGGTLARTCGAWDHVYRPKAHFLYRAYLRLAQRNGSPG